MEKKKKAILFTTSVSPTENSSNQILSWNVSLKTHKPCEPCLDLSHLMLLRVLVVGSGMNTCYENT